MHLAGATSDPGVRTFSDMLHSGESASPGWAAVRAWWSTEEEGLIEVLRVTKFVVGNASPNLQKTPRRLMAPAMLWAALEICRSGVTQILTLGGYDERPLWRVWERSVQSQGVSHLFVPELRISSDVALHMAEASISWTSRDEVVEFVNAVRIADAPSPALSWLDRYICIFLQAITEGVAPRPHFSEWDNDELEKLTNQLTAIVLDHQPPENW
jgi:hypothetical protein